MARKLNTLSARMVSVLLLIHAVLLPALFYGMLAVVENSQKDAFIDDTRIYARIFADFLESSDTLRSEDEIIRQLDSSILGGTGIYAALLLDEKLLMSSLIDQQDSIVFNEDFAFGEHGDDVYYLSIPITRGSSTAVLRMGFDESPTLKHIKDIKWTVVTILLVYLVISLILVLLLGTVLARPIRRLQQVSREIALGDYSRKLDDKSNLYEIRELAHDLEIMRSNLVGVNAQLQEEIHEREAAEARQRLLEARLRHSQRLESIGTLAGGIAHEFNNVLAPIMLYTDLALEDVPEKSVARQKLERVMALLQRAKGLSQQILMFGSKTSDAGRVAVDIAPVVEEGLSLVRALVPATVDIQTDIKHDLGLVLCDAAQIQQLVVNLCSNAFRSLSRVGGHIQIDVDGVEVNAEFADEHAGLREGKYVVLSVSDTGKGMDGATMERIFEPFFTTQEVGQGTGLGLSVVHGIVIEHDGDIIVSSKLGKGSTFSVYLPLVDDQSAKNEQVLGM
jgi:signal transduction histidine kinase